MAIEPIKGFYVYDEETETEGVARYDYDELLNAPDVAELSIDYSDNLISQYLSSGYYKDDGIYASTANFSYTKIDVSDVDTVEIGGTHHIYTTAQFTALGVILDSNENYIKSITSAYGGVPTSIPYELTLPTGSAYLLLNTDYNADYYTDSFPPNLYCCPNTWQLISDKLNKSPTYLLDLSDNKKVRLVAGAIRNTGDGWEFINDDYHEPLNGSTVSVSGSSIRITYGFTAKKVLSLVVAPDETYAPLYHVGASVGLSYSDIDLWKTPDEIGGKVVYQSENWDKSSSTFTNTSYGYGSLILYHESVANYADSEKSDISVSGLNCLAYIKAYTDNSITVGLKDFSGNDITPTDGVGVVARRYLNERKVSASYISNAQGNFWFFGVFEID